MHNILLQYETLLQVQKWGYKHCIACVDSQLTYMCIFSLWQQAYIKGAKWYRGGDCSWAVDTYKVAVDTVARGAVEATCMQIQFIFTLNT